MEDNTQEMASLRGKAISTSESSRWSAQKETVMAIANAAITAVDPYKAVLRCCHIDGETLVVGERKYDMNAIERMIVVGAGKATAPMAQAVEDILGTRITAGLVNVKYGYGSPTSTIEVNEASHPIPDDRGLEGTNRMAKLIRSVGSKDLVINLLSGGASALLELPANGISLADEQQMVDLLLRCGATINEINCVRKHISLSKGGNWAKMVYPARVVSLILSDVVGSPLDVIASGPTAPDTTRFAEACWILEHYSLMDKVSPSIRKRLISGREGRIPENPQREDPIFENVYNVLVGSNEIAAHAALKKAADKGFHTMLLSTYIEGEAREVARVLAAVVKEVASSGSPIPRPACILAGGETTVTIKGKGIGGRNQELALAMAIAIEGLENVAVWSLATDGNDGPTTAAGAIASGETVERGRMLGLEAREYLETNDSYEYFNQLGDLIQTGPTNTNVNDLMCVMAF